MVAKRRIERRLDDEQRLIVKRMIRTRTKKTQGGCWEVIPGRTGRTKGYPIMNMFGISLRASAWSYMAFNNPFLPAGSQVCHTCDNKLCANPKHLWLGSVSDNTKDAYEKGRRISPTILYGRPRRSKETELLVGRRAILTRWYGDKWREEYKRRYGPLPN